MVIDIVKWLFENSKRERERGEKEKALRYLNLLSHIGRRRKSVIKKAYKELYEIYFELGIFERAQEFLNSYTELEPFDAEPYYLLGLIYAGAQEHKKAAEMFENACKLDPLEPEYLRCLGVVTSSMGQEKKGLKLLKKALALDPKNPEIMTDLSISLVNMGRYKEALDILDHLQRVVSEDDFIEEIEEILKDIEKDYRMKGEDRVVKMPVSANLILGIYKRLLEHFGEKNWWEDESCFEVSIGAILAQATSWNNAKKAVFNLKKKGLLCESSLKCISLEELSSLIRPASYPNVKAKRIKEFVEFIFREYAGKIENMKYEDVGILREKLLGIKGIGKETADSILLYGLKKESFVVDNYTKRILKRHGIIYGKEGYDEIKEIFENSLPRDLKTYQIYHALFVELGKTFCKKIPYCKGCPLEDFC